MTPHKIVVAISLFVSLFTAALAEERPTAGPRDRRITYFDYDENQVYRVDASYGAVITIIFADDEKIETMGAGDAVGWKIEPNKSGNILFVKPVAKNANANLNVVTDKRRYVFVMTAAFRPVEKQIFQIKFRYEEDVAAGDGSLAEAKARALNPNLANLDVANTNSSYGYKGSGLLKPVVVFDDGKKTFFRFANDVPAIFLVDSDRNESLINYRREGEYIVVDRVNAQWTLRAAREQTCVFNLRLNNVNVPNGLDPFKPKLIGKKTKKVVLPDAVAN